MATKYTTDGGSGASWAGANTVGNDIVLEQDQTVYDPNSNPIETIDTQRYPTTFGTGPLNIMGTGPYGRTYFSGTYYDPADRPIADVNVGTNGGTAWVMPSTVPARSDTVLVNSTTYDAAGWVQSVTDPRCLVDEQTHDALDRLTEDQQNYTDGIPTTDSNQTTLYSFDGDNNTLTVTAVQPAGTLSQTTQYVYGVTTAGGSAINSNDLLAATLYPDKSTGQPSASEKETETYNALGQVTSYTDRNGNTHQLSYDVLGRLTSDIVTTLGAGVDGSVRRIDIAYDQQGNANLFTSYADTAGTQVVNQVLRQFNGLGQMTAEYQSVSGAVDLSSTPSVQYAYSEMSGGQNNSRLVSMTYPNGRVLNFNYSTGLDDSISRLSSISDNSGILEAYKYLGLGTVVERDHPQTGVNETFLSQNNSTGDAGDGITGLDRFGRIDDDAWINTLAQSLADHFQYTYDRDSNVLARINAVDAAFSQNYDYNDLNELTDYTQGDGSSQTYAPDAVGNLTSVTTNGVTQTRTQNAQNELTSVGSATPTYDANGNLTTDEAGQKYTYDAWNRLVKVVSGSNTVSYSFDALSRRITETTNGNARDLYFDGANVIEERLAGNSNANIQYVWDPLAVNRLVLRDRDTTGNGTLDERLYVQQDANNNVTSLVSTSGVPVEHYSYTPFGVVSVYDGNWNPLGGSQYGMVPLFQGMRYDRTTQNFASWGRIYRPSIEVWTGMDSIGFAGGQLNFYGFVGNDPVNRMDPSGLIGDAEASQLVNAILDGTKPLSELSKLSPQQLETEMAIIQRAVTAPKGSYPAELIRGFNEARLAFLRGAGERPGSLLEFAERWLARQSPEWVQANAPVIKRITTQIDKARAITARRAAQTAAEKAGEKAGSCGSRLGKSFRLLGRVLGFLAAPPVIAISEVLLTPSPIAGPGGVVVDQLMFPVHSPEQYYLPRGTYIMPNGLIYVPSPNSTFKPPPGTVRVTGRVSGDDVLARLQRTLLSGQVEPVK